MIEYGRGTFVIIDFENDKALSLFQRLKQTKAKVHLVQNKPQLDELYKQEEILAFLVSPMISEDIPRLKMEYKSPIFVVGHVSVDELARLYTLDIEDVLPPDFHISTLFKKLGVEEWFELSPKPTIFSKKREQEPKGEEEKTLSLNEKKETWKERLKQINRLEFLSLKRKEG
jgi:hypothetical protein